MNIASSFVFYLFYLLISGNYDFSSFDISCIAGYLKKYIRELPDSLIPIQWYDSFLEVSSK